MHTQSACFVKVKILLSVSIVKVTPNDAAAVLNVGRTAGVRKNYLFVYFLRVFSRYKKYKNEVRPWS